ncbi:hypothetical protein EMIT0P100_10973 [Pseudomonas sp. IT-P100]
MKADIGKDRNPAFVVGKLVTHLLAKRFDTPAFFGAVDEAVALKDVTECVAAFLPRLEFMLGLYDRDSLPPVF